MSSVTTIRLSLRASPPIGTSSGRKGFGAGWHLLRDSGTAERGGKETRNKPPFAEGLGNPGRRCKRLVFYTRAGCHLCDEARATLDRYSAYFPPIEAVDIDGDPQLIARFSTCVPVVEMDGKVRFRGRVNELLLRRLIAATPPRDTTRVGEDL